jgi:excisionase family DNA binding protein
MAHAPDAPASEGSFNEQFTRELLALTERLGRPCSFDLLFLAFLLRVAHFGVFALGPITINARVVEDRVLQGPSVVPEPDDYIRFSGLLMAEVRRSGRRRIDELHYLLAFMRCGAGIPAQVFGELAVTPEEVERYALGRGSMPAPPLERLMSPEEVADYLGVHPQTVRLWIRSGRLPARRVAGLRALRVRSSDVEGLLRPLDDDGDD